MYIYNKRLSLQAFYKQAVSLLTKNYQLSSRLPLSKSTFKQCDCFFKSLPNHINLATLEKHLSNLNDFTGSILK